MPECLDPCAPGPALQIGWHSILLFLCPGFFLVISFISGPLSSAHEAQSMAGTLLIPEGVSSEAKNGFPSGITLAPLGTPSSCLNPNCLLFAIWLTLPSVVAVSQENI